MKEFMLFITAEGDPMATLSAEQKQQHVQKVEDYIKQLIEEGKMKDAQPLEMEGVKIAKKENSFIDGPFNESKEVITGYYRILARDLGEASEIAKADPRFDDGLWKIEIRPIMQVDGIN
ncbi:MAG: YciI family protein [Cyclobacteriaceae bacterium]